MPCDTEDILARVPSETLKKKIALERIGSSHTKISRVFTFSPYHAAALKLGHFDLPLPEIFYDDDYDDDDDS